MSPMVKVSELLFFPQKLANLSKILFENAKVLNSQNKFESDEKVGGLT